MKLKSIVSPESYGGTDTSDDDDQVYISVSLLAREFVSSHYCNIL